jgi:glycosyltransferase involved in cell wall biosynthesis
MGLIESDYDKWIKKNQLTDEMIGEIKRDIARFQYRPKISIIMPVYNVDQMWLEKAIDSVLNQLYENWELCIADDASTKKHVKQTLGTYSKRDKRIRVKYLQENQGISEASNEALSLATGEFVGLLDHDDELSIDALYENVKLLNKHPEADLIYSDEDKIDIHGNRMEHMIILKIMILLYELLKKQTT